MHPKSFVSNFWGAVQDYNFGGSNVRSSCHGVGKPTPC